MGIIQGKAYWAKLDPNNPAQIFNTTANTDKQWTMDVTLDEEAAKILQEFDMSASLRDGSQKAVKAGVGRKLNGQPTLLYPKGHESDDFYFTFKCKAFDKNLEPKRPPQVVDADRKDITGTLIGNGSIVNVKFNEWLNPATDKHVLYLNGIQVVHLVPYEKGGGFEVIEGGFKGEPVMAAITSVEEDFESVSL
tara:strand:- start:3924 stop:4502 length:579 start_codon:yes stop_codon:yes gene_type:complete